MGFLKNVATAFKPSSIKQGLAAAREPIDPAAIEASLQHLTPEQRTAYDANMARVEAGRAEAEASWREAKAQEEQARVLEGPAGKYLYGAGLGDFGTPAEIEAQIAEKGALQAIGEMRAKRKGEFKQALRQTFNIAEVKELEDPAERARVAAEERAARDAARAPYLAADAPPMAIDRLATRGRTQLAEVLAHLHQSGLGRRPERIYGVYRVPDRISQALTPHSESGRVVEWDIVHAPGAEATPASGSPPLVATSFEARQQWVARAIGERSILDEDLALAFCLRAGIGPERCAGLARISEFRELRGEGDETSAQLRTLVQGVVALHPETSQTTFDAMLAEAPLELPDEPPAGIHVEVLNWEAVAQAVHMKIRHPPPVPSPFPYLPATPQELLRSYLQIVGVRPEDCYSAQATVDQPRALVQGGLMTTNLGPKQPCADGEMRMRTHGCEQVVVVYRDQPEYATGRERWAAYEWDVLHARLRNGLRLRPAVVDPDPMQGIPRILHPVARVADFVDRLDEIGAERLPAHRYCWPPVERGVAGL